MSGRAWLRIIVLAIGAGAGSTASAAPPDSLAWDWETRAPSFDPAATPSKLPILLYFTADWCGFCKQMERTTLADPSVRLRIAILQHIKVDLDQEAELAKHYEVDGVPAFLLVNDRGEEISRSVGVTDPLTFASWLEAGEKSALVAVHEAELQNAKLRQLAEAASSKDPAIQATVREQAFGFIGRGDPQTRKFATDYLSHLADTDPGALLDGLANPDLAVRIAVAGILRSKLGDGFNFDPWSSANGRQAAIDQLRKSTTR